MDLMKIATQLLLNRLGGSHSGISEVVIASALSNLLPTDSTGDLDLHGLVSQFSEQGMGPLVSSWLGDGDNSGISANQMTELLGESKVALFAEELGVDKSIACTSLAYMIPDLIDSTSEAGALLDLDGSSDMLSTLAKNALGSLFK